MLATTPAIPRGTVIVVDDDAAVRSGLDFLFSVEGYSVRSFPSGIAFLATPPPEDDACLVIDQAMPVMTGIEVVDRLRLRGYRLPVILIASQSDPELRRAARVAGIELVMETPVFGRDLTDAVAVLLAGGSPSA